MKYRVPSIVDAGHLIGRPTLQVDGHAKATENGDLVALAANGSQQAGHILASRVPGDPFHHLLARTAAVDSAARVVIVAETSVAMTAGDRVRQHAAIDAVLAELPASSKVTLLAADWDVSVVSDATAPVRARQSLGKLDSIISAGALHLERALTTAAAHAHQDGATAVVFVGRGLDGFGGDAVRAPLASLRSGGVRLSARR